MHQEEKRKEVGEESVGVKYATGKASHQLSTPTRVTAFCKEGKHSLESGLCAHVDVTPFKITESGNTSSAQLRVNGGRNRRKEPGRSSKG